MSHSQSHRIQVYTQTCMAQSLRQAYDYWQDQPDYYSTKFFNFSTSFFLQLAQGLQSSLEVTAIHVLDTCPRYRHNNPLSKTQIRDSNKVSCQNTKFARIEGLCSVIRAQAPKFVQMTLLLFRIIFPSLGTYNVTPFSFSFFGPSYIQPKKKS